ncbi:endolytic transglycosylase MltG [Aureivirga sp. CE67]|uniref:endolytic transglycosylase MltG n=1 Tax=Aureivirga sp. CE67 TaxID=1788983 RepID=UPI0018CB9CE1|nr:endolytic transglycosylase MltG [Aureivirga sp. CE67]
MLKKVILAVIAILIIGGGIFGFVMYQKVYKSNVKENFELYITENTSYETLVEEIKPHLNDVTSFTFVSELKGYPKKIKTGRYIIKKGTSSNDLINKLRIGNQDAVRLTFNNQNSLEKLAGRISQQIQADSTSLLHSMKDVKFLTENDFNATNALSMYIPNTYFVKWDISPEGFRKKMLQQYNKYWTKEKLEKAKALNLTKEEVIILASIVQQETKAKSEKPVVAGLYLNRLQKGMRLEADPTAVFGYKKHHGDDLVIKRVLFKHIEFDSPYNTYMISGLPPGPITMADISSIEAVLNYEKHNYLFMCAKPDYSGKHNFAKTNAQHSRNASKYRNWLRKQNIR